MTPKKNWSAVQSQCDSLPLRCESTTKSAMFWTSRIWFSSRRTSKKGLKCAEASGSVALKQIAFENRARHAEVRAQFSLFMSCTRTLPGEVRSVGITYPTLCPSGWERYRRRVPDRHHAGIDRRGLRR
jgi:hypothetical protein